MDPTSNGKLAHLAGSIRYVLSGAAPILCVTVAVAVAGPARAQTPIYEFEGHPAGSRFGQSVADAGDVNADGIHDVVVGAPSINNYVRVFSGLDGSLLHHFIPPGPDSGEFGSQVDGAGDVNADGYADIIVGQFQASIGDLYTGAFWVFSGSDGSLLMQDAGGRLDELGKAVSGAGDVNADGFDDVIVGARAQLNQNRGYARVYSGLNGSILHEWIGPSMSDRLGGDLAGVGDVNGDGHDDVLVGIPGHSNTADGDGRAILYSGKDGTPIHTFEADQSQDQFGFGDGLGASVAAAGDVNADGIPDVVISAGGDDDTAQNAGSVRVHSGADASLIYIFFGTHEGESFGIAGTGADYDADGHADLVIGVPRNDVGGFNAGAVKIFSGMDGRLVSAFYGIADSEELGFSVDGVEDIDQDGFDDFIVGIRGRFNAQSDVGFAILHSGDCNGGTNYCLANPNSAGPGATIGNSGAPEIEANAFHLTVSGAPPNQPGIFFYGASQIQVPFGNGFRCVSSGGTGIHRLKPPVAADSSGVVTRQLDFTQPPADSGPGLIEVFSTWNFQFWYRDPMGGGAQFNLSDAMSVIFCP